MQSFLVYQDDSDHRYQYPQILDLQRLLDPPILVNTVLIFAETVVDGVTVDIWSDSLKLNVLFRTSYQSV